LIFSRSVVKQEVLIDQEIALVDIVGMHLVEAGGGVRIQDSGVRIQETESRGERYRRIGKKCSDRPQKTGKNRESGPPKLCTRARS
jgi:hypothetical protein